MSRTPLHAVDTALIMARQQSRESSFRRWCFSVLVKPDKLAEYKRHHDEIINYDKEQDTMDCPDVLKPLKFLFFHCKSHGFAPKS